MRLQVRLRVGRLTLGLTVADRWECSQATGLPAWRHQDLHITANRAHGITGTQTEESVLKYWSRLDQAVRTCTRRLRAPSYPIRIPSGGKNSQLADNTEHTDAHILGIRETSNKRGNRRVNTLWKERQTTPRLG